MDIAHDSPPAAACGRLARLAALFASAAVLSSCGGGGDSGSTPAPAPGTGFQPPGAPVASATCDLPDFQAAAMARINFWRASGAMCGATLHAATTPLAWLDALAGAAATHSRDMAANNFFTHTGSDGSTYGARITAAGYAWSAAAENLPAGRATVNEAIDAWIQSAAHCANIMNPSLQHVGVACVKGGASNTYTSYWTMDLARPQ